MFTGGQDLPGVQEEAEHVSENSEIQDKPEESGGDDTEARKETARETVERVFKEAADNPSDGQEGAEALEKGAADAQEVAPRPGAQQKKDHREWDPDLQPPARYSVEAKEDFNRLPKGQKRFINQMVKEHEASFTRGQQQLMAREREIADIDSVIRPFVADWAEQGYSRSQAIAELVGTHEKLRSPDKKTRLEKLAWLCDNCDVGIEELYAHKHGKSAATTNGQHADIEEHPTVKALRNEISSMRNEIAPIRSSYQQTVAHHEQQVVGQATAEMMAVKDERDPSGRYRYPDLHDDSFLDRVKPIVSGLIGTVPNISWSDALKRAYVAAGGRVVGNSNSPQTIFPTPNQSNSQNRALSAAVSLRGKSGPSTSVSDELTPPPEALKNPRASVEWAFRNAGRGR